MPDHEKKDSSRYAQDGLTTTHLEKGLTSAHIRQQLERAGAQPQPVASSTNQPAQNADAGKNGTGE